LIAYDSIDFFRHPIAIIPACNINPRTSGKLPPLGGWTRAVVAVYKEQWQQFWLTNRGGK
jgi:hypothetical protein